MIQAAIPMKAVLPQETRILPTAILQETVLRREIRIPPTAILQEIVLPQEIRIPQTVSREFRIFFLPSQAVLPEAVPTIITITTAVETASETFSHG